MYNTLLLLSCVDGGIRINNRANKSMNKRRDDV